MCITYSRISLSAFRWNVKPNKFEWVFFFFFIRSQSLNCNPASPSAPNPWSLSTQICQSECSDSVTPAKRLWKWRPTVTEPPSLGLTARLQAALKHMRPNTLSKENCRRKHERNRSVSSFRVSSICDAANLTRVPTARRVICREEEKDMPRLLEETWPAAL